MPTRMSTPIRGYQMKVDGGSRRCHYCKEAKHFGYKVIDGPCQGFFCSPRHWKSALETMDKLKEKYNI